MIMSITITQFILRLLAATLIGLAIGVERQITGHQAGIRTNILVAMGSCCFVLFPMILGADDVPRVAAQIVSGVGFLGSGIIFKNGATVRGINTAATIWCTASVGVLCSTGRLDYAGVAAAILIAGNILSRPLVNRLRNMRVLNENDGDMSYLITVMCLESKEAYVRAYIMSYVRDSRLTLMNLESGDVIGSKVEVKARLLCTGKRQDAFAERLIAVMNGTEGVTGAGWTLEM